MHIKKLINNFIILSCLSASAIIYSPANASPFERSSRSFMNDEQEYKKLMGITAGVGKIETDEAEQGELVYANLFMFWFNLSAEYQSFENRSVTNTYTGVGLGRYFQLQYGYGDEGYSVRARAEFEVLGSVTVFISRERYRDKPEFDNYSAGLGYNF